MRDKVLIVDDDDDLRAVMSDILLLYFDREAVGVRDLEEVVKHGPDALTCKWAILDVNLGVGRPSGVEVHTWLRNQGFRGAIVFLTGHAHSHPEVERARAIGDARVLRKPIGVKQLGEILSGDSGA
jgi:FixJ family two-component response regulator